MRYEVQQGCERSQRRSAEGCSEEGAPADGVQHGLQEFKMGDLPKETNVIDTTWVMKKKSSGTLWGIVNVFGFKQIDGQHYKSKSISAQP